MGKPTLLVAGKLAGTAGRDHPRAVPIDYIISWVRARMPELGGRSSATLADRTLIVRSETGSGKSTVLPAYLLRLLRSEHTKAAVRLTGAGVMCTQPRILTAQTLARDQAADDENYPDLVMGATIGYQTGPVNEKPPAGLIYATAGTLLAQLRAMPDADIMARHRFIVVDEAHERSLDIDSLLMRLKIFLKRNLGNKNLPFVILASATLPVAKYARYFELGPENIIEVTGRAYGVTTRYPKTGTNNYPWEAAKVALGIHKDNPGDPPERADILIFMPGAREIEVVVEALTKANWAFREPGSETRPFLLLMISRAEILAQSRDYQLIKVPPDKLRVPSTDGRALLRPARRIVVATVVAETGLTIETLKYVVDCGWSRSEEVYYPGGYRGLVTRPAPRSRIKQRMGRAGRKFPGVFYPLYTKNVHDQLAAEQAPDIITGGVAPIFLDVVAATIETAAEGKDPDPVFRVQDIDMLDPPPSDALAAALEQATAFGYLRSDPAAGGDRRTRLGEVAGRFTYLGMPHVQTLLQGYLWRVSLRDLAFIVALYAERAVRLYHTPPYGPSQAEEIEAARRKALKAGLPAYLVTPPAALVRGGDEGKDAPSRAEECYYRARLLISDDFIEALLVFEGFVRALENYQGDVAALLDWCAANGVDFEGATYLAGVREQVISEMLVAGLNPFWGEEHRLASAPADAFFDTVVRLKHCIHAGLRFSMLTYDAPEGVYRARTGEPVDVPPAYADAAQAHLRALGAGAAVGTRPQRLVTNTVRLRGATKDRAEKYNPLLYRLVPGLVSVLDGYVPVDTTARAPRGE